MQKMLIVAGVFTALLSGAAAYWGWLWTYSKITSTAKERLHLYSGTFTSELNKYRYLPFVIANDPRTSRLMTAWQQVKEKKKGIGLLNIEKLGVNNFLADLKITSKAAALYVMDRDGLVLAASHWEGKNSLIGKRFGFHSYFLDSITGSTGEYFAIGKTIDSPEYYISSPIRLDGKIVGVAVTKIDLTLLQAYWQKIGEPVLITDEFGVTVVAGNRNWLLKALKELPPESIEQIRKQRRYGRKIIRLTKTDVTNNDAGNLVIDNTYYYYHCVNIGKLNWTTCYLTPGAVFTERMWEAALIAAVCGFLVLLLAVLRKLRREQDASTNQLLEARRFKAINETLATEIEERKKTEVELKEAQEALIQAGKLTALGQMAAAMAHELNQPITALKMSMFNARKMLMNQQPEQELIPVFTDMEGFADRMRLITEQLKAFARKEPVQLQFLNTREIIDSSLKLVAHLIESSECEVYINHETDNFTVEADTGRLEQVIVNLIRNAIEAMEDTSVRSVTITTKNTGTEMLIYIRDSGTGISENQAAHIFEPFYTDKQSGNGIGLGLAISKRIMENFKGQLSLVSHPGEGACFEIMLPAPQIFNNTKAIINA